MKKYKLVNFCEFDKYATKSYCAIHGVDEILNLGDITEVDVKLLPQVDIITHGSPCQSFSLAGKQEGGDEGSGTKSSLLWNSVQIIEHCNPKFVIWENVKNVLSPNHKHNFDKYIEKLENMSYTSHYKILDASKYGIPQGRERIFCISIRNNIYNGFEFPKEIPLKHQLEDLLDFRDKDDLTINFLNRYNEIHNSNINMEQFIEYIDNLPITKGIGGKKMNLYNFGEMDFITMPTGITGTLTCRNVQNYNKKYWYNNKLYKPSPRMVWRLMGFSDEDYEKSAKLLSDKELYNRGGNSIVVDVAYEIFKQLYTYYKNEFDDLKLISLFSGIGAFEKGLDRLYDDINNNKI